MGRQSLLCTSSHSELCDVKGNPNIALKFFPKSDRILGLVWARKKRRVFSHVFSVTSR